MSNETNGLSEKLEEQHKIYLAKRKQVSDLLSEFGSRVYNYDPGPAPEVTIGNFHEHYLNEIMKILNS